MICPPGHPLIAKPGRARSIQLLILCPLPVQSHSVPPALWRGSSWWVQTQQEYWGSVRGSERLFMISES